MFYNWKHPLRSAFLMTAALTQMSRWQCLNYGSQWHSRWVTSVLLRWLVKGGNVSLCTGHRSAIRGRFNLFNSPICHRRSANLVRWTRMRRQKPDEVHWASSLIVELWLCQVVLTPGSLRHVFVSDSQQGNSANKDSQLSLLIHWSSQCKNNTDNS